MHSKVLLASALPSASRRRFLLAAAGGAVSACGGGGGGDSTPTPSGLPLLPRPPVVPVNGPAWVGFGGDTQHTALGRENVAAQTLRGFYWYSAIDLAPQLNGNGSLLTHYGSPVITRSTTVMVPVKTTASGGFVVTARVGATGDPMWALGSDYVLPPHNWIPSFNPGLARSDTAVPRLYVPGLGGKLLYRDDPDAVTGPMGTFVFYTDLGTYFASQAIYNNTVFINTPITTDGAGNAYYGFTVTGSSPAGPPSGGIARVDPNGVGTYLTATQATGDATLVKTQTNAAPALSNDGATLYVVFNSAAARPSGRLVALDATTLATIRNVPLLDPANGQPAWISDDSTASPLVGPDGDVYIGVLESAAAPHNFRGWLLHFNGALTQTKTPGAFGWDNTPSIVPATVRGTPGYLLLTKYNNYLGAQPSGDGNNRIAVLDPSQTQPDPVSGSVPVMREVITIAGPTAEGGGAPAGAVREWCVNTAVVDPISKSALVNSEDGTLYRWDLVNNQFSERIALNAGVAQSYTPTVLGPDGRIYAVNNAILHSIGQ
jgi:hypothetical protein